MNDFADFLKGEIENAEGIRLHTLRHVLDKYVELSTPVFKVIQLEQTCYACPAQWEGMVENGEYLYIRYRWGRLSVSVGRSQIFATDYGDSMGGIMDMAELTRLTKTVLDFSGVQP